MDVENQYGLKEMHGELLKLLHLFDTFCQQHSITYSVSSGTLLGAIRHNGFIPWDDDLDITLSRKEYERLISIISSSRELKCEKVLWIDRIRLKDQDYSYAPTIDVFVWDCVPDNRFFAGLKYFGVVVLQGMIKRDVRKDLSLSFRILSMLLIGVGKLFPMRLKLLLYETVCKFGNSKRTLFLGGYHDQFHALRFKYPSKMLDEIEFHTFEDMCVPIFRLYDQYLTIIYGENYLLPPPKSQRIPSHLNNR